MSYVTKNGPCTNIKTAETDWWFVFQGSDIIIPPMQCSGVTSTPYSMCICGTYEECMRYIANNGLVLPQDDSDT